MISSLNHITFSTQNLEKSFNFYQHTLGLYPIARWQHGAYFLAGNLW